jgi:hypothetical protein
MSSQLRPSGSSMNVRTSIGAIPEKLFVNARAIVTAGLVQKPIIAPSARNNSRAQAQNERPHRGDQGLRSSLE